MPRHIALAIINRLRVKLHYIHKPDNICVYNQSQAQAQLYHLKKSQLPRNQHRIDCRNFDARVLYEVSMLHYDAL